MNDLITAADTVVAEQALLHNIHGVLQGARFRLRKYQSNILELLQQISKELVEQSPSHVFGDTSTISILGIGWNPMADQLNIRTSKSMLLGCQRISKCQLLSEVVKFFNPLRLLSPFTIRGKLFIQRVWKEEIDWDSYISAQLYTDVQTYLLELPKLSDLYIQRSYSPSKPTSCQLIGFCDASDKAYCAIIYLCCTNNSSITTQFICAKTPVKSLTIPRLELQGALLLSDLADRVMQVLRIDLHNIYLFCDSEVILAWLAKPENPWNVFVRNRIHKISAKFPPER